MSLSIDTDAFPISKEVIEDAITCLVERIIQHYPNGCTLCGVMVGALPIVQKMQECLNKKSTSHLYPTCFIGARSYVDDKQKNTVGIYAPPSSHLINKRNVVIVDDVVDSGKTVQGVGQYLREKFKPKVINVVALCAKGEVPKWMSDESVAFLLPKDPFVIGCGMDYNGEYRDLMEIRPITEEEKQSAPSKDKVTV